MLELGAGFHPDLTGRENIFLNGSLLGISRREMSRRYDQIVDFAEIGVKPDQKIVLLNGQMASKEKGFVKGHKYDVRATRLIGPVAGKFNERRRYQCGS